MCTFILELTYFIFNKCLVYSHDSASAKYVALTHTKRFTVHSRQNAGCYAALFDGAVYGDGRAPDVGVHGDDLCPLQAVVLGSTRLRTAQGKHVTAHISSDSYSSSLRLGCLR
jgi:hypothetical protein